MAPTSTPAFKRLPRAVREQQMLDSAVRIFSQRGFHAASMDEIAEQAGISKPMVYAYLGSKEELFIACLRREADRLTGAVTGAVEPDLPPDQQLWQGLRAFFGFVGAYRDGWRVLYRQSRGEAQFAAEVGALRSRIALVVVVLLQRALATVGRRVGDTELEVMAYALVGAGESLADWLAEHPREQAEVAATRMMDIAWLGAGELIRGASWRPPVPG